MTSLPVETWQIISGKSVGPFIIGSTLADVISSLKCRKVVKSIELTYGETNALEEDIMIKSPEDGMNLIFDPWSQRLKLIDIYDISIAHLSYGRTIIATPTYPVTLLQIYELFGPTYPGKVDGEQQIYFLQYPGICFAFPIPKEHYHLYFVSNDIPMELPDGSSPTANRIVVFHGNNYKSLELPPPGPTDMYMQLVEVKLEKSNVQITFTKLKSTIGIGWSLQDIVSEIGSPTTIYRKDNNDAMVEEGCLRKRDYFHNYPHLGMDILYDGELHHAKKYILRTNFPGHPEFNSYVKCNFKISLSSTTISPDTRWSQIKDSFPKKDTFRPVVHGSSSSIHPFGSTYCYTPSPGCTLEVMKNDYIASVTLSAVE